MEVESYEDGYLASIVVGEGEDAAVRGRVPRRGGRKDFHIELGVKGLFPGGPNGTGGARRGCGPGGRPHGGQK
ncbi:hypothetical protein M885DRAFT_552855 [Pelagophyceae sp. CCMP2097]|nr:hypothetical protein M885DRAFT_552855 [Pelagophyceae sp. CCMP2097]